MLLIVLTDHCGLTDLVRVRLKGLEKRPQLNVGIPGPSYSLHPSRMTILEGFRLQLLLLSNFLLEPLGWPQALLATRLEILPSWKFLFGFCNSGFHYLHPHPMQSHGNFAANTGWF